MEEIINKLGITEYREIIATIKINYGIDMTDYALTSLKRRFEKCFMLYNFRSTDQLIDKLKKDKYFFENFLNDISVPTTEMFRDPPMWKELKEIILPRYKNEKEIKIWVPEITTDDELFSLLIILYETELLNISKIYATSIGNKIIENAKKGYTELKKMETNTANYKRIEGHSLLSQYFTQEDRKAVFNKNLLNKVIFQQHNLFTDSLPEKGFKLILFRNRMLYYNPPLQTKAIKILYESLVPGGYFICGVNESLECCTNDEKFSVVNPNENIFKKSLF